METSLTQIAKLWLQAFNKHDLEELLSLYDSEAIHYSPKLKTRHPETNGFIKGKEALRLWWQDAFERLPQLVYEEKTIITGNDIIFMEYIRHVPGEENMNVGEVLEIKNSLIVSSRVYHG